MAFVRKRGNSHQLVETYRKDGEVRQRVIANLGPYPTLADAYAAAPARYRHLCENDTTDVVSEAQEGKEPRQRRALLAALAPMVPLSRLIAGGKAKAEISRAFQFTDGADQCPPHVGFSDLVKAVRAVSAWLPEFISDIAPASAGKRVSRADQWRNHVSTAIEALEQIKEMQSDYETWRDGLPQQLQDGPTFEKLETVIDIDVDGIIEQITEIGEAELPLGFGRD